MSERLEAARAALFKEMEVHFGSILIRQVDLHDLLLTGGIPVPLIAEVDGKFKDLADDEQRLTPEAIQKVMPYLDRVVIAAVVDPPITQHGGEDSLPVNVFFATEKLIIAAAATPGSSLGPFRTGQQEPAGTALAGDDVSPAAEPDTGDHQ
jgi:hypothetical protein